MLHLRLRYIKKNYFQKQFKENELGYIYVLKDFQGKGIGGKLLDTVIPYLERPAFLEVFPSNIKAKRLYKSRGFVEETKEKMILD